MFVKHGFSNRTIGHFIKTKNIRRSLVVLIWRCHCIHVVNYVDVKHG